MKLNTINYIRDLLEEKEAELLAIRKKTYAELDGAKKDDSPDIEVFRQKRIETWDVWSKCRDALEDFNAHDWR